MPGKRLKIFFVSSQKNLPCRKRPIVSRIRPFPLSLSLAVATGIGEGGSPAAGWEAGMRGEGTVTGPPHHGKESQLPRKLTTEVAQTDTDGMAGWARAEPDFSSRGKKSRRNKCNHKIKINHNTHKEQELSQTPCQGEGRDGAAGHREHWKPPWYGKHCLPEVCWEISKLLPSASEGDLIKSH